MKQGATVIDTYNTIFPVKFKLNFACWNNILEGQFVFLGKDSNELFVEILLGEVLEELNRAMVHLTVITFLVLLPGLPLIIGFLFQIRNLVF